jgi:hypothetical protein
MTLDQVKTELEATNDRIADARESISRLTIKLRIMEEQKKALSALLVVLKELDGISDVTTPFADVIPAAIAANEVVRQPA